MGWGGGWAACFVRLVLAFPAEGEAEDVSGGRVGEGLGGGGGEGDFSPAAAAFQRDSARPRGREAGTSEWGKEPLPDRPAHL